MTVSQYFDTPASAGPPALKALIHDLKGSLNRAKGISTPRELYEMLSGYLDGVLAGEDRQIDIGVLLGLTLRLEIAFVCLERYRVDLHYRSFDGVSGALELLREAVAQPPIDIANFRITARLALMELDLAIDDD